LGSLLVTNLLNYIDRYIFAAASPKIQTELALTNFETGLLLSAFMVGYMVVCPFVGHIGDRASRPKLMAISVAGWSIATLFTGLVSGFFFLFLSRILVGVFEAGFSSIAPSYIRDTRKDDKDVNKAFTIFYIAIPVGSALGFIYGGAIAEHWHWRIAFYTAAIPGILCAIWMMRQKEIRTSAVPSEGLAQLWQSCKTLAKRSDYRLVVLGYTAYTFGMGGFAVWAPKYGVHHLGVPLDKITTGFGVVTLVAAVLGTALGGRLSDATTDPKNPVLGFARYSALTSLLAVPFGFWAVSAHDLNTFLAAMFVVEAAMFSATAPVNTMILSTAPRELAATAMAVSIFCIHALGDLISPPIVGALSDVVPMNLAMIVLVVAIALSAVFWGLLAVKASARFRKNLDS
jgi:MFS family permease